ncbi:MAG TPA: PIN domain-containing protein [Alphaproteobacteria bacterium]|nr:PIN domain-containing protein [Alphaproteobacteria bacterium]
MNIYVEANFVLELALLQEQHASCEDILRLCEAGSAGLFLPAYSLVEPYETLVRRHWRRRQMKRELEQELGQLRRTALYTQRLGELLTLTSLLIDSVNDETKRLEDTRSRLLSLAHVIPLDISVLAAAARYQIERGLSPQDAVVYAAVLSHLRQSGAPESCFLNKNSKDFDDPGLVEELNTYHCRLIPQFDDGYHFILSRLA